ncbi:universal stress protein [Spirosoma endophyticum]|uniref:Nucleotide-binding universal stress protein, UspA family n=1 Tax=Spirosoma endophyticum TaxID=662367 RepID=A0A1I1LW43_9BACT|nr:universal stress protein [Spirosoma endophyticum]SFC77311.1 Nucleotide-binding universal stress protein, UspA family [Spirosoma endophyticum]
MKKILMLTDFSEASRNALSFAQSFFSETIADFHLLTIYPAQTGGFNGLKHNAEAARSATTSANQLQRMVIELRQQATHEGHTFRSSAMPGNPLEVVEQIVQTEAYDFVVIGPQQNDTYGLFGNSAIGLVHELKANILVVPTDATPRPIYQVVLAIDFANLRDSKLLDPLKELVTLKEALLTLLTIKTPDNSVIHPEQELHIRQFLNPIKPNVTRLQASSAKEGIDAYLAEHPVDLLVTIPRFKGMANAILGDSHTRMQAYTPLVPLLTLYNDGSDERPELVDHLSTVHSAL